MGMQGYSTAAPRIGKTTGGIIKSAMPNTPVKPKPVKAPAMKQKTHRGA